MALKLKANNGNLDLSTDIGRLIKGDDGGYYIPAVDEEGNLSWVATEDYMPAIEGSNIKGPQGEPGKDGVDGKNGLDGKDGAPGKDGLDGKDGINGKDGKDGINGTDGKDGVDGKDGEPGVYVGTEEPTDESLIWINPEGSSSSVATQEYVDNAIANALAGIANAEDGAY